MQGGGTRRSADCIPSLVPGWESKAAGLSPQEAFVLSRIDGTTPWSVLRDLSGLPADALEGSLERWEAAGLVALAQAPQGAQRAGRSDDLDPTLEIPLELQQQILDFEQKLDRPYHELLGVAPDADEKAIKRAYFQRSRDFHPDRYFRREIGPYLERLNRIFKRIVLAYELMMDPATRAELARSHLLQRPLEPEPHPERSAGEAQPADTGRRSAPYRKPTKREMLERLRRQFKIPEAILAERRQRARQIFESARVAMHQGRSEEAAGFIRLAIVFDPWSEVYKEAFAGLQGDVSTSRAERLLQEAEGALHDEHQREALKLLEEALTFKPSESRILALAARAAQEVGERAAALEYAERAVEIRPDVTEYQLVLGRIRRRQGLKAKARAALEEALRLDPANPEVQEELRLLGATK